MLIKYGMHVRRRNPTSDIIILLLEDQIFYYEATQLLTTFICLYRSLVQLRKSLQDARNFFILNCHNLILFYVSFDVIQQYSIWVNFKCDHVIILK